MIHSDIDKIKKLQETKEILNSLRVELNKLSTADGTEPGTMILFIEMNSELSRAIKKANKIEKILSTDVVTGS